MKSLRLKAYPKVNITLKVLDFDKEARLHKIDSRMRLVVGSLFDTLSFEKSTDFSLSGFNFEIESNLIFKAYKLLKDTYDISPYKIGVIKNIPFGAGLGGGSVNAALTLLALNHIEGLNLEYETLLAHAKTLGMDICFFICVYTQNGKFPLSSLEDKEELFLSADASNFGEVIKPFYEPNFKVRIFTNDISCNTASVYKEFGKMQKETKTISLDVATNTSPFLLKHFSIPNDLQIPAFKLYPQLKEIKANLIKEYKDIYFSGSGGSFFTLEGIS
ncbi:hypothetical protein BKH43_01450 [Helicobacter sp. 13S00401-1]|uniref:GHMP family kinase ATP-binding protein n=1 Tax=Helicobacter sp. 13S00401-1 TaxID=1905758 RepID=UPI000BA518F8|nr:hypothetical protein [Helicobacter sp. 13S00401-1]PAF51331.1 hypothetical protein BKH43_01450 [Helicobacter sp. 13S00401-1]